MTQLKDKVQNGLDECRMLILTGQVLLGFCAHAVLEPGFPGLSVFGKSAVAGTMLLLVMGVGVLMCPAAYHAIVLERQDDPSLLVFCRRAVFAGMAPFAVGLGVSGYVILEHVGGIAGALGAGLAACGAAVMAWYLVPLWAKAARSSEQTAQSQARPASISDQVRHVLTECRMVLPGAQAMLGFATIAVLMDRYRDFDTTLRIVHVVGMGFIVTAVVLLMMPAALHRIAEDGEDSERFLRSATRLLLAAMAALAPAMAAGVWIVLRITWGSHALGAAGAAGVITMLYGCWFGWTWIVRSRNLQSRESPVKVP